MCRLCNEPIVQCSVPNQLPAGNQGKPDGGQKSENAQQRQRRINDLDRQLKAAKAKDCVAFQSWWRESRSQSLQPRDPSAPSATERLEALKARIRKSPAVG